MSEYKPPIVSPPGDTIIETMKAKHISQMELSRRTGIRPYDIKLLLRGEFEITQDVAEKLSEVLGCPVDFWLNREKAYRNRKETEL